MAVVFGAVLLLWVTGKIFLACKTRNVLHNCAVKGHLDYITVKKKVSFLHQS